MTMTSHDVVGFPFFGQQLPILSFAFIGNVLPMTSLEIVGLRVGGELLNNRLQKIAWFTCLILQIWPTKSLCHTVIVLSYL